MTDGKQQQHQLLQHSMKLQPDKSNAPVINAYGRGWIEVNGQKHDQSLIVSSLPQTPPADWAPQRFEDLTPHDFEILAVSGVELVIFGSGTRLRFPQAAWLKSLMAMGIGLETMDTPAACRTYNILASEGRKVIVALIIER
jgi:uncharacterized protein